MPFEAPALGTHTAICACGLRKGEKGAKLGSDDRRWREELRRTSGVSLPGEAGKARTEGTQARSSAEPQNPRLAAWSVGAEPHLIPVDARVGGRGSGGALSRCPGAQWQLQEFPAPVFLGLAEKQKRWAGRRWGENGWRVGGVPRTLPQRPPMVEKGLARGGTSRLEALPRTRLSLQGSTHRTRVSPLTPPSVALS